MKVQMVFCDEDGRIYDHPKLLMAGMDGPDYRAVPEESLVALPDGSDLMVLPGRHPVGIDPETGAAVELTRLDGEQIYAASAFMAPAYVQTYRAAFLKAADAPALPLFAYTALGYAQGRFYAAGFRVDDDTRQDPFRFDMEEVKRCIDELPAGLDRNRLIGQLKKCALDYCCRAAQNFFLGRHEAPLPVSTVCNASCIGCISLQKNGSFKASHDRLQEPPSPEEIAEVALVHIGRVDEAVVSFGQGCEGEPLLRAGILERAIRVIRRQTNRGTINLNTNGSEPQDIVRLLDAGLDSIRVSMNSFRPELYTSYFKPRGYDFRDVIETIVASKKHGCFVSVNLLVFPGVTDTDEEISAMADVLSSGWIDFVQMRNLNIDPDLYAACLPEGSLQEGIGVVRFMEALRNIKPDIRFGYFNPPKERFHPK